VQCGIGRTGKWFAHQHAAHQQANFCPDVMTLAKGLGSGVPVGACLTAGAAAGVFKPGNHGSTFGGNPLACVAALTTLDVLEEDHLLVRATALGERIRARFAACLAGQVGVVEIRGSGLMIGVELDRPCAALVAAGLEAGFLINVTADKVIRLLPPLIMTDAEADELVDGVATLVCRFLAG
jgi:acetylornithine aminotransferase